MPNPTWYLPALDSVIPLGDVTNFEYTYDERKELKTHTFPIYGYTYTYVDYDSGYNSISFEIGKKTERFSYTFWFYGKHSTNNLVFIDGVTHVKFEDDKLM